MLAEQLRGVLLLMLAYMAGTLAAGFADAGIPGAIFGLLLCLCAVLAWRPFQEMIRPGANVMLALIPLCLVPLLVRMIVVLDFATAAIWLVIGVITVCALLGVVVTGLIAKLCLRGEGEA